MTKGKIKILYCITKSNWGGAQRYVYDLATSLPPDLYNVSVLLGAEGILAEKLKSAGIKTIILEKLTRDISILKDILVLLKMIKAFHQERPDVIHLNSSKTGFLGALAGRLTHIPKIIFTGHGWAFNEDRSKFEKKIIYWLHWLTIKLAHKTIAVSEETKKQISKNTSISNKIIVIKNGISEIDFLDKKTAREIIVKKLPYDVDPEERLWLGTISELHKNKGLKYIIEALHIWETSLENKKSLPILIIIGDGEHREQLQQKINRYNLQDTIFLIGRVAEAAKYLKAFDIFTLNSITEALPYVILEAGQAGLPIVSSGVGGIPEIIEDMNEGILVRPKEPEEIRKALIFLINNAEKRSILAQNIQKKIQSTFSKKDMVFETIKLYN